MEASPFIGFIFSLWCIVFGEMNPPHPWLALHGGSLVTSEKGTGETQCCSLPGLFLNPLPTSDFPVLHD